MVNLPLVYGLVLVATTLADNGYPTLRPKLRPDARCKYVGQFLSHPKSSCMYVRCDYGNEPWHDSYGKVKLFAREMACAPGTSVPEYFDSAEKQGNPCTQRTSEGNCKGSYTPRRMHKQHDAFLNHGGLKSPIYGRSVGLRGKGKIPYPQLEPRKYKGHQAPKAENYGSKEDYPEEGSSEKDYNSNEEYFSKGDFPQKEEYPVKEGYEPKGDYHSRDDYSPKGNYNPKREYQPKEEYAPQEDYHQKGDYPQRGDYSQKGDYSREEDYPTKGDYAPRREYPSGRDYVPPRETFPFKGDYNTRGENPSKDDYPTSHNYGPKSSQVPKDDYPPKGDYPHNYPDSNPIHTQKGAIFPPGDHHVGSDKYDSMADEKDFEFMHEDFKKDIGSPFRSSFPSSKSEYSPPRGRYVMRGAREAPAGPYPQTEEVYPTTESSEEGDEDFPQDFHSREDESPLKDDDDDFPFSNGDESSLSENDFPHEEPFANIKESYHPLKDRYPSPSRVPPREEEGHRISNSAFPFLKDALVALKNSLPPIKDSDPLDEDTFTSKENPYSPSKDDFPGFPSKKPVLSSDEGSEYVKSERSRYEGPSFRPAGKVQRNFHDGSDTEEEYPKDRDD